MGKNLQIKEIKKYTVSSVSSPPSGSRPYSPRFDELFEAVKWINGIETERQRWTFIWTRGNEEATQPIHIHFENENIVKLQFLLGWSEA